MFNGNLKPKDTLWNDGKSGYKLLEAVLGVFSLTVPIDGIGWLAVFESIPPPYGPTSPDISPDAISSSANPSSRTYGSQLLEDLAAHMRRFERREVASAQRITALEDELLKGRLACERAQQTLGRADGRWDGKIREEA
ncbi:MAG: hypothetical protein M1840_000818 [Geoglossum simile]|nr:MAG: hypothetical protein M1840_000818 [Geoglossum simile]